MKAPLAFLLLRVSLSHSFLLLPSSPHHHVCPTFPFCSLDAPSGRWVPSSYNTVMQTLPGHSRVTAPVLAKQSPDNPCWYEDGYCQVSSGNSLRTNAAQTAEECSAACASTAACEYFTFLHHRGAATCSLLTACDTFTQCPSTGGCASGPKACSCPAIGIDPPEDGSTLHARWRCGDLDPYTSPIPVGTVCTVSCAAWKEDTFKSQCMRGGTWSASTPLATTARLSYASTNINTPDQPDMVCGCQDVGPFNYDPNDEPGAELVCRGGRTKDFKAEGGWSLTTTDHCDLWCSHVPVVSVFCLGSQWQGEPERGFWCYQQPDHPEPEDEDEGSGSGSGPEVSEMRSPDLSEV